jgi:hypothetical protein
MAVKSKIILATFCSLMLCNAAAASQKQIVQCGVRRASCIGMCAQSYCHLADDAVPMHELCDLAYSTCTEAHTMGQPLCQRVLTYCTKQLTTPSCTPSTTGVPACRAQCMNVYRYCVDDRPTKASPAD